MNKRAGFTLIELILAVFISGFMLMSLATIFATSDRNMFQNYRNNVIKNNVEVAMKAAQNGLFTATRLDAPAYGAAGNFLSFATNVDRTGCYPILAGEPAAWHHFCIGPDPSIPGVNALYYHTAPIAGGTGCSSAAPSIWGGVYPVPPASCGQLLAGQTVTLLMRHTDPNPVFFSRRPTETVMVDGVPTATQGVTENNTVRVMLHTLWTPPVNLARAQRPVDFTMDSVITVNMPAW